MTTENILSNTQPQPQALEASINNPGNLPLFIDPDEKIPAIDMSSFINKLTAALFPLIKFLKSDQCRNHPVWGNLLPYEVESYGSGSAGYCVRPDVVLTPKGPKICELDFVPSGRGFLLDCLPTDSAKMAYLNSYRKWYGQMGYNNIGYAIATIDSCLPEVELFSKALKQILNININPVNVDETNLDKYDLVDRLYYRSEVVTPNNIGNSAYVSSHPFMDSKMVLALIHDPTMEQPLIDSIGLGNLIFLHEIIPETYALQIARQNRRVLLELIARDYKQYVIKNGEVETQTNWGSRGVMIGSQFGENIFREALFNGKSPKNKVIGNRSIVQKFSYSYNFSEYWDAAVAGSIPAHSLGDLPVSSMANITNQWIYSRLGIYFLLSERNEKTIVPKYALLTMRPDRLAHGASNTIDAVLKVKG